MLKLIAPIVLAALAAGCSPKVKQQRPPRIEDEDEAAALESGGTDMAEEPEALEPAKEKKITPEEQKAMCCAECAKGAANDRSGDDPAKIPCADFTADLTEKCLKWFRANPIMASEAAACAGPRAADAAAAPAAEPASK